MDNNIYEVVLCGSDDIDNVRNFIDKFWKKDHALAVSKELIDFQHYEVDGDCYNFIIAKHRITKEVDGILGFINTAHYDPSLASEGDYWGAIWKVRDDIENEEIKTLGLNLFEKFQELTAYKTFGAIGISQIAKRIYKALRYKIGVLNQYFILNQKTTEFKIATIVSDFPKVDVSNEANFEIKRIFDLCSLGPIDCKFNPRKTTAYLINRYLKHPIYKYVFFGIYGKGKLKTVLVARVVELNNSKIIRIVDLLGDYNSLPSLYSQFQGVLSEENAEYIDCLNYGISEELFMKMGFNKLYVEGENIIPTYFEPFEKRNVAIEFAYRSSSSYMIFKGDSDQDRPNIL